MLFFNIKIRFEKKIMSITRPINFLKWIEDNKDNFKPPVNNKVVYKDAEFIIMVVGGPNSRKDYHYNESEEFLSA